MPIYRLPPEPVFPPPHMAEENGLLAIGGDLSPERLIAAYSEGIFPWYSEGQPLLWWSPDPRLVLKPDWLHVPRSLKKTIRRQSFAITFDCAFPQVIRACADLRAGSGDDDDEGGTWITVDMESAYVELHRLGIAHSVEAWVLEADGPLLAGGAYGVALGGCFFGESMFHRRTDASKVAFVALVERLRRLGFSIIDCQMTTDHLLRFGAREVPRALFLTELYRAQATNAPIPGSWRASSPAISA